LIRRCLKGRLDSFVKEAQNSLASAVAAALEVDANRFRQHLETNEDLAADLTRHIKTLSGLLQGERPPLESVPEVAEQTGADGGEQDA